jgi:hypothetical protein
MRAPIQPEFQLDATKLKKNRSLGMPRDVRKRQAQSAVLTILFVPSPDHHSCKKYCSDTEVQR